MGICLQFLDDVSIATEAITTKMRGARANPLASPHCLAGSQAMAAPVAYATGVNGAALVTVSSEAQLTCASALSRPHIAAESIRMAATSSVQPTFIDGHTDAAIPTPAFVANALVGTQVSRDTFSVLGAATAVWARARTAAFAGETITFKTIVADAPGDALLNNTVSVWVAGLGQP